MKTRTKKGGGSGIGAVAKRCNVVPPGGLLAALVVIGGIFILWGALAAAVYLPIVNAGAGGEATLIYGTALTLSGVYLIYLACRSGGVLI
ncbi:MAG: hypothetical protein AB1476_05250 [Candidatus Hadarchaeota archaeon]